MFVSHCGGEGSVDISAAGIFKKAIYESLPDVSASAAAAPAPPSAKSSPRGAGDSDRAGGGTEALCVSEGGNFNSEDDEGRRKVTDANGRGGACVQP